MADKDARRRAETKARLFSAAESASTSFRETEGTDQDRWPPSFSSPVFSSSELASPDLPDLPDARVWEVGSDEADRIEAEHARLHRPPPIQRYM